MSNPPDSAAYTALTNALQPARRAWVMAANTVLVDHGLPISLSAAVILTSRSGAAGIRQIALAEEVGVNPGAMVRILDQAEAASLLERRDCPNDRRSKIIHILPRGRDLAAKMEQDISRLRDTLLDGLPVHDIALATRVLRQFEERIGAFLSEARARR